MQFQFSLLVVSALAAVALAIPNKRQIISSSNGTIESPTDGDAILPGANFSFAYKAADACESGYSPIAVYLQDRAPLSSDVDSTGSLGSLANGTYLYFYGNYLIPNFGLPAQTSPPPPPSVLQMPDLSASNEDDETYSDVTVYLTVVETYEDCPGDIPYEYGITSNTVVYNPSQ